MLSFIAQLKAAARQCGFTRTCKCNEVVDFTDTIVLYKLLAGVSDADLQGDLLKEADLTLEKAEKMAVTAESAKNSQDAMSG